MNENMEKLQAVIMALNNIETRGKQNLLNLGGAIELIENVAHSIADSLSEGTQECKEDKC